MRLILSVCIASWVSANALADNISNNNVIRQNLDSSTGDCVDRLSAIVCAVDNWGTDNTCQPRSADFLGFFQDAYGVLSPVQRKLLCSLDRIYIDRGSDEVGAGTDITTSDAERAIIIGEQNFVLNPALPDFISWMEQNPFTASRPFDVDRNWITTEINVPGVPTPWLYYILSHELGHVFDLTYGLNKLVRVGDDVHVEGYGAFSWSTLLKSRYDDSSFSLRALRVNWGGVFENPLDRSILPTMYQQIRSTDFLTMYSTSNPWDDFAETFALREIMTRPDVVWRVKLPGHNGQNQLVDMRAEIALPRMTAKVTYISEKVAELLGSERFGSL